MDQAEQAVPSIEDRIAERLFPKQPEKQEAPKEEAQEQPNEAETTAEPEENAQAEGGDAKDGEEQADETLLTPEQLEHYRVKIKIDGEESEVTLKEAREGYQREADYRRKTQELSKEKAEIPKKISEEVAKKAEEYQQRIQMFYHAMMKHMDEELTNTDWNKLVKEEPTKFLELKHRQSQAENFIKAAQQEMQKYEEAVKKEKADAQAQALEQAQERLKSSIPGWGEEVSQKITKSAMEKYGFSKEELSGIYDARYVEVLHDAMQYRVLKEQKSLVDKKVAEVPKVLKPGTQQSRVSVNAEREKELRAAVKKSGHTEDIAALLLHRQKQARR